MMNFKSFFAIILLIGTVLLAGCSKDERTIGGALIGGSAGAGIGAAAGGAGGAAAGGVIGAVTGGIIGRGTAKDK